MRVLAVGGGSGGHVTPIVAVLDEVASMVDGSLEARLVCDRAFEKQARVVVKQLPFAVPVSVIAAGKLRRYRNFKWYDYVLQPKIMVHNLADMIKVCWGTVQSLYMMIRWRPDVIFAKGGYVCLPIGWAARILRVQLVIHDSDARPGLTSRLLASSAAAIATGFPLDHYNYDAHKSYYVGVPVRAGYARVGGEQKQAAARRIGLSPDRPIVVSMGGGLGSRIINHAMVAAEPMLNKHNVQVVMIAGKKLYDETIEALPSATRFRVYGFVSDELRDILASADIVVTRASATSLQELAALQKAIVAMPARQLGDQQYNAKAYGDAHAAVVVSDDEAEDGVLSRVLERLILDSAERTSLATQLHRFARPHAARDTAALIVSAAHKDGA